MNIFRYIYIWMYIYTYSYFFISKLLLLPVGDIGVRGSAGKNDDMSKNLIQNKSDNTDINDYSDKEENIDENYSLNGINYDLNIISNDTGVLNEISKNDIDMKFNPNPTTNPESSSDSVPKPNHKTKDGMITNNLPTSNNNQLNTHQSNQLKNENEKNMKKFGVKKFLYFLVGKSYLPIDGTKHHPSKGTKEPSTPPSISAESSSIESKGTKEPVGGKERSGESSKEHSGESSMESSGESSMSPSSMNLWTRSISYTHYRDNVIGMFTNKILSNHTQVQIMNIDIRNNTDDVTTNKTLNNSSISLNSKLNSISIITYTNLSLLPYCQNCSYTTRYEFRNSVIKNEKNQDNNSNSENDNENDIIYGTDVSIHLNIICPPSFYRSFIISGIKKELNLYFEKFNECCNNNMKNYDKKYVKSIEEKDIFYLINQGAQRGVYDANEDISIIENNGINNEDDNENYDKNDLINISINNDNIPNEELLMSNGTFNTNFKNESIEKFENISSNFEISIKNASDENLNFQSVTDNSGNNNENNDIGMDAIIYTPDILIVNKLYRLRNHWRLSSR